jgi:transposase
LIQRLTERLGVSPSLRTLTRLIHRLGFRWRRPKLAVKESDPYAAVRQTVIQVAHQLWPEAVPLYGDECDVLTLPLVRAQYQPVGQQVAIRTPGTRQKQAIFGFLDIRTGAWHYWLTERKRSVEFIACLHALLKRYPTQEIVLCLDNAGIHKSRVTQRYLRNHPRLIVCWLPSYSGHKGNPVEKVWWQLKQQVAANYLWPSRDALQDAIHEFFAGFSATDALRLTRRYNKQGSELSASPRTRAA